MKRKRARLTTKRRRHIKRMKFGGREVMPCAYCGTSLTIDTATLDHVRPVSRGGAHAQDNLVLACAPCNNAKGCKTRAAWMGRDVVW